MNEWMYKRRKDDGIKSDVLTSPFFQRKGDDQGQDDPDDGTEDHRISFSPICHLLDARGSSDRHRDGDEEHPCQEAPDEISLDHIVPVLDLAHAWAIQP